MRPTIRDVEISMKVQSLPMGNGPSTIAAYREEIERDYIKVLRQAEESLAIHAGHRQPEQERITKALEAVHEVIWAYEKGLE